MIAASTLRERPEDFILACDEKWEPFFRKISEGATPLPLLPLHLEYTTRNRKNRLQANPSHFSSFKLDHILSIRGDFRDWLAARKIFPNAEIRMSGWLAFFSRRLRLLDILLSAMKLPIRNRYRAWATLSGIPFSEIESTYHLMRSAPGKDGKVIIHVGAQWKSKQYPHVNELKKILKNKDFQVQILAGPKDQLPQGISEAEVHRVGAEELVDLLSRNQWVIANDSGPMHLAAFLGAKTFVISRVSNIEEWLPPGVIPISSSLMPKGYAPDSLYTSDEVLDGWPDPEEIAQKFEI